MPNSPLWEKSRIIKNKEMVKITDVEPRTTTSNSWRRWKQTTRGMLCTRMGTTAFICCFMVLSFWMGVWMSMARSVIVTMPQPQEGGGGRGVATRETKYSSHRKEGDHMLRQQEERHKESMSNRSTERRNIESNQQQGSHLERGTSNKYQNVVKAGGSSSCPYQSLNDLTKEERFPKAGPSRHMVTPPPGGWVDLVCCETTKGPWSVLVHERWAPLGAKRFLEMVQSKYFSSAKGVPLMRCVSNFLCQFGLNGFISSQFGTQLPDDPNWLPPGKEHRQNELGVKRFQKGYFSYAGAGPNTRSNQLFVALHDNGALAGGSPWEVPWGELVGAHSSESLDRIYTGYGEHGPTQGWLHRHDSSDPQLQQDFPLLDYVTSCQIVDREFQKPQPELSNR